MAFDLEIAFYALATLAIIMLGWIAILEIRLRRVFRGSGAGNLEHTIHKNAERVESLSGKIENMSSKVTVLEQRLKKSLNPPHVVRFNAFHDAGGNQSFATAFLNDEGSGVLISSLYGRERVGIYAKPISNFTSDYEISTEERKVLDEAKKEVG